MHSSTFAPVDSIRRRLIGAAALVPTICSVGLMVPGSAWGHLYVGALKPPQPAPKIDLRGLDGIAQPVQTWLRSPLTAVQLMFTGCSATCPLQGAMFAQLQHRLDALSLSVGQVQLLSISIDPLGDDPKAMRNWLSKHGANTQRWRGAMTSLAGVDRLLDFLEGRAAGADRHSNRVYLFDERAQLIFRTEELPAIASVLTPIEQWFKLPPKR